MRTAAVMLAGALLAVAGVTGGGCSRDGTRTAAPAATPTAAAEATPPGTPVAGEAGAAAGMPPGLAELGPADLEPIPEGPLVIWAEADPEEGRAPLTVRFKVDEMEEIEQPTYTWNFGDGSPEATGTEVTHTYTKPGSYVVRVVARDAHGNTGADRVQVDVLEPAKEPS